MIKEFKLRAIPRAGQPRSKRLRAIGGGGSTVGGSTVVNVTNAGNVGGAGSDHSHDNKSALDQISIDAHGYEYITHYVERVNEETGEPEMVLVTEKVKAGYADKAAHADTAHDLTEDSPLRKQFLSRVADDVAAGRITFEQGLIALGLAVFKTGAHFGEFVASLHGGTGGAVDERGNAEFESVRIRSYFEAMEFVVNRLSAIEGDQLLTEADTIERVDDLGGGLYGLHLRSKWEGYYTGQAVGNVLKGVINDLSAGRGNYRTCWLRVNKVDTAANYIEAALYPDDQTPAGKNYVPVDMMHVARWGNQTDERRQSCLYLSSAEGRIVHLTGVTRPIIAKANYGASFGTLPDFLRAMQLPLVPGQDYVYVRGIIAQDVIRVDYQGQPLVTYVDRGDWKEGEQYYNARRNPATGVYETSDVWYHGCRYRCIVDGTSTAPGWGNTAWAMVEGDTAFAVDFGSSDIVVNPKQFKAELMIKAKLHNQDVTAQLQTGDVDWTRYSEDADGQHRIGSDTLWHTAKGKSGLSLTLTPADMGLTEGEALPGVLKFSATVSLRDSAGKVTATDTATCVIRFAEDGQPGERGAIPRGPQNWGDCPMGYDFQSAAPGETYQDLVIWQGQYYYCKKSHKKSTNFPGSSADINNGLWGLGDKIELVAARLVLAQYALVKNLGVEAIEMKDARGKVIFRAKDGAVECKTGKFENVKVSGDVTAQTINLVESTTNPANGSLILARGIGFRYTLPELPEGACRVIYLLYPLITRVPADLFLAGDNSNVMISSYFNPLLAKKEIEIQEYGGYMLLGTHTVEGGGITYWNVSPLATMKV